MKLLCIVLILVLAAALLILTGKLLGAQSGAGLQTENKESVAQPASEAGKAESTGPGESVNPEEPKAAGEKQEEPKATGEKQEEPKAAGEKQEEPKATGEKQEEPKATGEKQEEPKATGEKQEEPKEEKLGTLDGIAAGTIVTKDELDTDQMGKYFQSYEIKKTGAVYKRINGKSYRENPNVALEDLRYLKVLHYNFDHQRQVGELIVNKGLADDMLQIFRELYDAEYEIQSMHLVDNYWTGDGEESDSASIDKNNTSAFNYRPVTGGKKLSNHAYGFAIDINPQQNPYVSYRDGVPRWSHKNADAYIDRTTGKKHMITHGDLAFRLFKKHGFTWGGDWNSPKDYQHFEKKPD